MPDRIPFTLVLSGGGLKGLAHVGVLQALQERHLEPGLVIGSSMGALVAAAWATGMPLREMRARALEVRRKHVFVVAHADMALRRMLAPAVYRREPLDTLIGTLVGTRTFKDLKRRLLVNTVDLNSGVQVLWGLPGLDDVPVADAVFASCALPGILPPRIIRDRYYVDGAVIENLPLRFAAAAGSGPIIAINLNPLGPFDLERTDAETQGFASTYIRGLEMVMQTQSADRLHFWHRPPLVLVQPRVGHISMFAFDQTEELIIEGYRSMLSALDTVGPLDQLEPGIHPRRPVRLTVDRDRCVGCGACALWAPDVFHVGTDGRAEVLTPVHRWSPVDGTYVSHCPTHAIHIAPEPDLQTSRASSS
jgi:NTE family protein